MSARQRITPVLAMAQAKENPMIPDPILFGVISAAIEEAAGQCEGGDATSSYGDEGCDDGEYDYDRDPEGLLLQYVKQPGLLTPPSSDEDDE